MIHPPPIPAPDDPAAIIARLERRLAREREARLAAEAIAESGTLTLYRQTERLRLVESIATKANAGDDPAETFGQALADICAYTGWPIGHVFMFSETETDTLCCSGVWHGADAADLAAFRKASAESTFTTGCGLPGRVMASREAEWIEDVTQSLHFPRRVPAAAGGLRGGFAFPALIGDEVGAVLEFFSRDAVPPDAEMLEMLNRIGAQLGRVVERYRNARRLRAHNEALSSLYAEAEAQRHAAEAASRAKSNFLAVTSHEIRTPLNAVLGLSEALKREPLTARQHELNEGVLTSGQMLLRLLNAVLDMSKIEADQAEARLSDFDLRAKLDAVVAIWSPRAAEMGVRLDLDSDGLDQVMVRTDEGRVEQTLINLVSNGLKFTPAGGVLQLVVRCGDDRLRIEVIDGGPGVPDADRHRIFRPFEQTDAGRAAGGAGLGLAICTGNMKLLGGAIGTDRTGDGRSRFWIEVPVQRAADAAAPADDRAVLDTAGLRILAADDNPANLRVLEALLIPAGVDLVCVENGREAVDILRTNRFDLVLMDANMPVMDGAQAVRAIRAENLAGGAAVHMLTANAFAEDMARYQAAGADGVLTKPIQIPQLYAVLRGCAEASEARRAAA